ncbi:heavy metal-associated domain-containing protein [Stappia sp.]|uniref:heavy-metal-associated domain-containing protein n=1 Tax=Stappia sp. TaxID=1870903 RepID=UPI0025F2DFD2|nr:heavy metal-associated domain-containing protein [Stappia sp.]
MDQTTTTDEAGRMTLMIEGMDCQGCVRSVENAIRKQDPKAEVAIDLATGRADVGTTLARDGVVAAIEGAGFDVTG